MSQTESNLVPIYLLQATSQFLLQSSEDRRKTPLLSWGGDVARSATGVVWSL